MAEHDMSDVGSTTVGTSRSWRSELPAIAGNHTQVAGVLAGFSATIVVLFIGLRFEAGQSRALELREELALGLFTMAFFGYVATGILYSISTERHGTHRDFLFSAASVVYYFSGVLGFTAVYPLTTLVEADAVRYAVMVMVIGGLLGGYLAAAIPLHDLFRMSEWTLLAVLGGSATLGATLGWLVTLGPGPTSRAVPALLVSCAVVVVLPFNVVAVSFFNDGFVTARRARQVLAMVIATATAVLAFGIAFCLAV